MNSNYQIVTVCSKFPTESYYCLSEFINSLKGEKLVALGTHEGEYGGLGSKPRLLYHAIKNKDIDAEYLIFCDCFDFVFAVDPFILYYQYLNLGMPIVISAEKNCFPTDLKEEYDKLSSPTSYKYLNSGLIVGETEAILTCLEAMDAPNIPNDYWDNEKGVQVNPNDQLYWQQMYLKQPVDIALDFNQELCNTLHDVKIDELEFLNGGYIKNKETQSYPCSFHFNGGAKTGGLMQPILKHLNL